MLESVVNLNIKPVQIPSWYFDCIDAARIIVGSYFGINPFEFFYSTIVHFDTEVVDSFHFIKGSENISSKISTVLDKYNLEEELNIYNNWPIDNLKKLLIEGSPVIVCVDSFYENIRPDTYKIHHLSHSFTLSGFNAEQKIFYIIEHNYSNSLKYELQIISYESLQESMMHSLKHLYISYKKNSFIKSPRGKGTVQKKYLQLMRDTAQVWGQPYSIELFIHTFECLFIQKSLLTKYHDNFIHSLFLLEQGTTLRHAIYADIWPTDRELILLSKKIVDSWTLVRIHTRKLFLKNFKNIENEVSHIQKNLYAAYNYERLLISNILKKIST